MTFDLWLGFAVASIVMGLIPGPGVMSIVGYAIGSGRTTALASVAGLALGNVMAMTLSLAGVGALLATSALAFSILKWVGAIYLIGLGLFTLVKSWGSLPLDGVPSPTISPRAAFANNVAVGVFHPKTIVFFVAFAPQFISTGGSYILQAATLVATFRFVVGCTDTIYALVASRAANLMKGPRAVSWSKRCQWRRLDRRRRRHRSREAIGAETDHYRIRRPANLTFPTDDKRTTARAVMGRSRSHP